MLDDRSIKIRMKTTNNWNFWEIKDKKNKIIIRYDFVEILRQGIINSKQIFKLEKETSFTYITKEFKGKYIIFTKKMTINDLKILLEYDIMDKNEIINSIKLEISNF